MKKFEYLLLTSLWKLQITLSLPSFGSNWVFGRDELTRLLSSSTRRGKTSHTLDAELLSGIREHIFGRGRNCERVASGGDSEDDNAGSAGAVTVFLYLLAATCDTAALLKPRAR